MWLTADGVAVLDHDGIADPDRSLAMADVVAAELPPHVPRVAELFELAAGGGVEVSLDVKDPAAVPEVVRAARDAGVAERLWLCHHRWRELASWRVGAPDVALVDSTYLGFMSGGPAQRVAQLVAAGVDALNLHHSEWTAELVDLATSAGLRTLGWDAQDAAIIARLAALGLDGIFGDDVALLVATAGA